MYDPSDLLASKGQVLEFYQTFSGATVVFKAFVTSYKEDFVSTWTPSPTFGRPDPIQTYQGTQRSINISWDIPAFDLEDAQNNLAKTSTLTRMLYPEYSKVDSASTISKGSLIKMKFANLIFDASRGPEGDVRTSGLLGIIKSISWNPNVERGFFDPADKLFPKVITLTISFTVLHQHTLGWEKSEPVPISANRKKRILNNGNLTPDERIEKINGISDRRRDFAENAAPSWGPDASLFPWSPGVQRTRSFIGNFETGDLIQEAIQDDLLEND